jgi:hypothetical protein
MKPGCVRERGEGPSWEEQVGAVAWPIFVPPERRQALARTREETVVHSVRFLDQRHHFASPLVALTCSLECAIPRYISPGDSPKKLLRSIGERLRVRLLTLPCFFRAEQSRRDPGASN